jgi:hypothetical protein
MIRYRKPVFFFLFLVLIAGACTERIDVKVGETYTRLVVDGHISTDTMAYSIDLTKSADYFYNAASPRVSDALVMISDGEVTDTLRESLPENPGVYQTKTTFFGKPGKTYTLTIELAEPINGQNHFTAACTLEPVAHLDSTKAILHPDWGKDGIWEIIGYAQEPGNQVNYYMFNLYRNGQLLTDSIQKVRVSDDKLINGSYFNGGVIYLNNERQDEQLIPGDHITLVMSGITQDYMNFVQQVQESGFNIPFFSGPPANIIGNISNGAVGFFSAYSNSKATAVVK